MRNVTKLHITRIKGLQGERLYGKEQSDEDIGRQCCSEVKDEGTYNEIQGSGGESESDEDIDVRNLRSNVERAEAEILQYTPRRVKKGEKYLIRKIRRCNKNSETTELKREGNWEI